MKERLHNWKSLWCALAFILCASAHCMAADFDTLWKQAQKFEAEDLPESALKVVRQIAKKADKEHQQGQQLASLLYECKLRQKIVPDSFFTDILKLERLKRQEGDDVRTAIIASALGELYADGQSRARYRKVKMDAPRDSIREWSGAQYESASHENFLHSMSRPMSLAEAKAADYLPFIQQGKDADYFGGDLLNVIGRRAAQALHKDGETARADTAVYARMLAVYRKKGMREAELLVMLDSIENQPEDNITPYYAETKEKDILEGDACTAYRNMLARFDDLPIAAEIYLKMVQLNVSARQKVEWAEEGYARHSSYPRAQELLYIKESLETPKIAITYPEDQYAEVDFNCVVTHRNVQGAEWRWYRLPDSFTQAMADSLSAKALHRYVMKQGRLTDSGHCTWPKKAPYEETCDTFILKAPDAGPHAFVVVPDGMDTPEGQFTQTMTLSRMKLLATDYPDGQFLCTAVNARTGNPEQGATVELLKNGKVLTSGCTDANGQVTLNCDATERREFWRHRFQMRATKGDDRYMQPITLSQRFSYHENNSSSQKTRLYTDRAIYRPGQTVFVGGICSLSDHDGEQVESGRQLEVSLVDPNRKTIEQKTAESDEMGALSLSFVLPEKALSGRYFIKAKDCTVSFSVEEYKRPAFEVTLYKPETGYAGGDTLLLTGTAMGYNGVPMRQARVCATTWTRTNIYYRTGAKETSSIALDTVYTDAKGQFAVRVPISTARPRHRWMGLSQTVSVDVLSSAGETQTAEISLPLARAKMSLAVSAPDHWVKESMPTVKAVVKTAAGTEWKDSVRITAELVRTQKGQPDKAVATGISLNQGQQTDLSPYAKGLTSGCYTLKVRAVTEDDTTSADYPFVLFSKDDKRPADGLTDWYHCFTDTVSPGRPAHIQVGSGADSVTVYYLLFCKKELIKKEIYSISDSVLHFTYDHVPEDADGLFALFFFVKDGKTYSHGQPIAQAQPDKNLHLEWLSFRNRLQPGTEEQWQLRITLPDGKPAPARLMATLYDASLDGIRKHRWSLPRTYTSLSIPHAAVLSAPSYGSFGFDYMKPVERRSAVRDLRFDCFNASLLEWEPTFVEDLVLMAPLMANAPMRAAKMDRAAKATVAETADELDEVESEDAPSVPLRDDMRETAFFYPHLSTDRNGTVTLNFVLPDALTTWNFMGLAHTRDMKSGMLLGNVVAAKEVMAQLELPRFARVGDRTTLSATLTNLTTQDISGKVTMELLDPYTEKVLWKRSTRATVNAEADTVVHFLFEADEAMSLTACRVVFETDSHSDGEQRYLPVLDDKEWLTQTLPFTVTHKGDTAIQLGGLFQNNHPQAEKRNLTLEYTANPIWYAIQALPSVLEPSAKDVLSLGAAYYASTVSAGLADRYPQIKKTVELWAVEGDNDFGEPDWNETPWANDEDAMRHRMQSLWLLFDTNTQRDLRARLAHSLGLLQLGDGSFSWFQGLKGSTYLTQRAALTLLRCGAALASDSILAREVQLEKMMNYLAGEAHGEVVKDKERMRDQKVRIYNGAHWLNWLYLNALCSGTPWKDAFARADVDYMMNRLEEDRFSLPLTAKAMAATVFTQAGKTAEAKQMAQSLVEHLTEDAQGLHIEYTSGGLSYGSARKIGIHTTIMEALALPGLADTHVTDGLCRWLLSQKRLQDWTTTAGTASAVHALLQYYGKDLTPLTDDRIRLTSPEGKTWTELNTAESHTAGLGTVSAVVAEAELEQGAGSLTVTKGQDSPSAWGAVYARFRLPMDAVESAASGVSVRCEVSDTVPKTGDRLTVRYVITSGGDYNYMQLTAGHAACLEPTGQLSGRGFADGLSYYKEMKDASTNYYIEHLGKGTYVIEEDYHVERAGHYVLGAVKLNGLYAPEFSAYGAGVQLEINE